MTNSRIKLLKRVLQDRESEAAYADAYWEISKLIQTGTIDPDGALEIGKLLGDKIERPAWACIPGREPWRYL